MMSFESLLRLKIRSRWIEFFRLRGRDRHVGNWLYRAIRIFESDSCICIDHARGVYRFVVSKGKWVVEGNNYGVCEIYNANPRRIGTYSGPFRLENRQIICLSGTLADPDYGYRIFPLGTDPAIVQPFGFKELLELQRDFHQG